MIINNSDFEHGLRIPRLGVAGKEVIEFTADKAGEFTYYCSVQGHKQKGQWGTLKVIG